MRTLTVIIGAVWWLITAASAACAQDAIKHRAQAPVPPPRPRPTIIVPPKIEPPAPVESSTGGPAKIEEDRPKGGWHEIKPGEQQ